MRSWAEPVALAAQPGFRALYVYGSALREGFDPHVSDVNVLLVVDELPFDRLERLAHVLGELGTHPKNGFHLAPLLLTERQIRASSDVFPMDFTDLLERRALVSGEDVLANLEVRFTHLRHQCEYELQSKLVGLRQAYVRAGAGPGAAHALTVRAAGGSAALFRHLLTLVQQDHPQDPIELSHSVARAYRVDAQALAAPFVARREETVDEATARSRLAAYLVALESLASSVNDLPGH
ncbi:MAG: hypothetical protein ACREOU_04300 [Candidatus Eiseniibacteriota bacterium]